jgi:TolB-like protein
MLAALAACLAGVAAAGEQPAAPLVAILEFHNQVPGIDPKTNHDGSYLADVARTAAAEAGLRVMTRENVLVLLQANGRSMSDCVDKCEIDTARLLGASYVVTGTIIKFGSQVRLSLRLHDTAQGTLLMGAAVGGMEVGALESGLPEAMNKLLAPLKKQVTLAAPPRPDRARQLAVQAEASLMARDFKGAVDKGLEALREAPTDTDTLRRAYRALGYGYAYRADKPNAVKYLSEYLPYCTTDCEQIRAFGVDAPRPPIIEHQPPVDPPEGRELVLRAKFRGDSAIAIALVQVRQAGAAQYTNLEMKQAGDAYEAKVPADQVRGTLEYFIAAKNAAGVMQRQGAGGPANPFVLHVKK